MESLTLPVITRQHLRLNSVLLCSPALQFINYNGGNLDNITKYQGIQSVSHRFPQQKNFREQAGTLQLMQYHITEHLTNQKRTQKRVIFIEQSKVLESAKPKWISHHFHPEKLSRNIINIYLDFKLLNKTLELYTTELCADIYTQ